MFNTYKDFRKQRKKDRADMSLDCDCLAISERWMATVFLKGYAYQWDWLGVPMIHMPTDIMALQEVIFQTKPELIIETGLGRGGGLVFLASMLRLLGGTRLAVSVEANLQDETLKIIEEHHLNQTMRVYPGSSSDPEMAKRLIHLASDYSRVMLVLDSCHTEAHVLQELELLAPLVTPGCCLVITDTCIETAPQSLFEGKSWGRANSPLSALWKWLPKQHPGRWVFDEEVMAGLLLTDCPKGFLRKTHL